MFPCTHCQGSLRKCYVSVSSKSARCGECVKRGLSCDVRNLPMCDWAAIEREEARVAEELTQTTAELHKALARQSRLLKQQEFVRTRAKEMLQRGLNNLDELDEAEEKEQKAAAAASSSSAAPVPNFSFDPLGMSPSSFDRWATGAGGGTPPTVLDS